MSIDFPPGALPYCVFSDIDGSPRIGVGSGTDVVDLSALGIDSVDPLLVTADRLNPLLAAGRASWGALRDELVAKEMDGTLDRARRPARSVEFHLAWEVTDFVDFYSSRQHAENMGAIFRPDADPLPANWLTLPVGYHGRAGTVSVDGTPVRRPHGLARSVGELSFGPTNALDFELEVGYVVGGPTEPGQPVPVDECDDHLFGVVLVNDWTARDIQAWEYVPLGPFLGKSFATSVSAWVMPLDAIADSRVPAPVQVPAPAAYLQALDPWTLRLDLEVWLRTAQGDEARIASVDSAASLYWTPAQQLAHMTVNGARIRAGDLFGTGTVSDTEQFGCLIERTRGGKDPFAVGDATRTYLEDGDKVVLRGRAGSVPLGPVGGIVQPAHQ